MKLSNRLNNYNSLIAFLILECLAITSFALGGNNSVFYVIGILIGIFAVTSTIGRFSKNEYKSLILFLGIMFLISLLTSFGNMLRGYYGLWNVITLLAINAFLFMGIAGRRIKSFTPELFLIVVGFSITLLVLISMVYSWTQYGFFYAYLYKNNPIYYYNANLFDVTKEGYWLSGFTFKETTIKYTSLYAFILVCYLPGLLFLNPKNVEQKRSFWFFLAFGFIGLIYLITIPYLKALIFLIPIIIFAFCYKFFWANVKFRKAVKIVLFSLIGIAFIAFLIMLIYSLGNESFNAFIESNKILGRLFVHNRYAAALIDVLKTVLSSGNFFGVNTTDLIWVNEKVLQLNSGMFEIELLKEGGILLLILIVAFIILIGFIVSKYLRTSKDKDYSKIVFVSILIMFFLYSSFNYDAFPLTHESNLIVADLYNFSRYYSFFRSPLTLVMLSLIGYIYVPLFIKDDEEYGKEILKVNDDHKTKEIINDEYSFDEEQDL